MPSLAPLKILVWGINYAPEVTGIAPYNRGLCEYLSQQGHEVHMLTTFPYYPEWKKRPEDQTLFYQDEMIQNVHVHRCWHYVPPQPTPLQRILHEASFVCNAFIRALFIQKIDRIILISPPLPLGIAGWILSLWKGAPFIFHIQDLQPDAGIHMGLISSPLLQRFLYACEKLIYSKASKISSISQAIGKMIEAKGVEPSKIVLFPNWFHPKSNSPSPVLHSFFRNSLQIPSDALILLYSGNFGKKQGLEIFMETARLTDPNKVHWIFCGDGAAKNVLLSRAEGLSHVHFIPLQETEKYHQLLSEADLCLVSQVGGTGKFFFPSKLLSILSHGKPVITVADSDSELAHAVTFGFGINHPTHQPEAIAQTILELNTHRERLTTMAELGQTYVAQFEPQKILSKFEEHLHERLP